MINMFSFCEYNAVSSFPIALQSITKVLVKNGIFDVLDAHYLEGNPPLARMPDGWDFDTIMRAEFNGDASAGNVDISFYSASYLRIKRREIGSNEWIILADIPVSEPDDFNFAHFDRLNRSNTDYEYAMMPVFGSIEGAIVAKTVHSQFDGICLFDGEKTYYTIMDIALELSRSQVDAIVKTLGRRYPVYVKSNAVNYDTGDVVAFFVPKKDAGCGFTTEGGLDYRETLIDFLTSSNAKILKDSRGYIWIVQVQGDVASEDGGHPDYIKVRFPWVQIGNARKEDDLLEFGFLEWAGE